MYAKKFYWGACQRPKMSCTHAIFAPDTPQVVYRAYISKFTQLLITDNSLYMPGGEGFGPEKLVFAFMAVYDVPPKAECTPDHWLPKEALKWSGRKPLR